MKTNSKWLISYIIFILEIVGCAPLIDQGVVTNQTDLSGNSSGMITSEPSGAAIYVLNEDSIAEFTYIPGKLSFVSNTPAQIWINYPQGMEMFIVIEKDGYESIIWPVLTKHFDHKFELKKDYADTIKSELPLYEKEFRSAILDLTGAADKTFSSPRFMAGAAFSEANTRFERITIDFPQHKEKEVIQAVRDLLRYLAIAVDSEADSFREQFYITMASLINKKIKMGIGITY